ncbi:unnamed protein product, partial [Prorocentrum cordatum]
MAKVFMDGTGAQELIGSPKTVLAASSSELAANLSDSLVAMGIPHSASDKAVDLGVDAASGRRRARAVASARIAAGARRWRLIMKLRRATARPAECRGSRATGVLPQSVYGRQVSGAPFGLVRQRRRRRAGHAVGGAARGRCLASVLAAAVGLRDPRIALRVQLVASWCSLWFSNASLRGRIERAWPWFLGALRRVGKWRQGRFRGPMGACQATLLDMGWGPRAAAVWARPTAEGAGEWRLVGAEDEGFHACADFGGVLQAVEEDLRLRLWRSAASRLRGGDLVGGADFLRVGREINLLGREEGRARCGCAGETLRRRIWQCPAIVGEVFVSTAALVPRALAGHEASPAMCMRGVPISCATAPVFCDQRVEQNAVSLGADSVLGSTRRDDGFVVVYGDGSSGKCSDDPGRRRCATSVVAMGQDE